MRKVKRTSLADAQISALSLSFWQGAPLGHPCHFRRSHWPFWAKNHHMRRIPLTQGRYTLVDYKDFKKLSRHKWHLSIVRSRNSIRYYASTNIRENGRKIQIRMHRLLLSPPKPLIVDHIDGNGLNNTRSNLRVCTKSQNNANRLARTNSYSRLKGVYFLGLHRKKQWTATIVHKGIRHFLGTFFTKEDAYHAYTCAAIKFHGQYALQSRPI